MIFIRFAGCNLKCSFCDTDYSIKRQMNMESILVEIKKYPCKHVCLTGGEPLLQADTSFLRGLYMAGYIIHVETNGTIEIEHTYFSWITVSPKQPLNLWKQKSGDEIKIVYEGQDLSQFEKTNFKYFYLQPLMKKDGSSNAKEVVEKVKGGNVWKLSVQVHKLIGER